MKSISLSIASAFLLFALAVPFGSFAAEKGDQHASIQGQISALLAKISLLQQQADAESATSTLLVIANPTTSAQVATSTDVTKTVGVFTIKFEATATAKELYIQTVDAPISGKNDYTSSQALTSSADFRNGFYVIEPGDTESFTVSTAVDPNASGKYMVRLRGVSYHVGSTTGTLRTTRVSSKDKEFWTPRVYIPNSSNKGAAAVITAVEDAAGDWLSSLANAFDR